MPRKGIGFIEAEAHALDDTEDEEEEEGEDDLGDFIDDRPEDELSHEEEEDP